MRTDLLVNPDAAALVPDQRAQTDPAAHLDTGTHTAVDVVTVPIDALVLGESPRAGAPDAEHVRTLAEVARALPPILVHRSTMRVLDGVHRLQALRSRGAEAVAVRFYNGDESSAFVQAVRANTGHGLPLTLAERTSAAARILRAFPDWSDRRIAAVTGLSPKTAGAVRARSREEIPHLTGRIGRDSRTRQVPAADISVDVRADARGAVQTLSDDPSLRFSDSGRALLRLFNLHAIDSTSWESIADAVPRHCATTVAGIARNCAEVWMQFADRLDSRRD